MKKFFTFLALYFTVLGASAQQKPNEVTYRDLDEYGSLNFSVSYVNKEWVTEMGGKTIHENFWGEENKRLHGVQIGFGYTPHLPIGIGIQTGLYYEFYTSMSDYVRDRGWDRFNEHCLYAPLHLMWKIPFGDGYSITPYAGLGFNWSIYGNFKDDWSYRYYDRYYGSSYGPHEYERYGNGNPRRWNNQLEFGGSIQFNSFQIGFTYSKGLTNHHLYDGCKSLQNKICISVGFLIEK